VQQLSSQEAIDSTFAALIISPVRVLHNADSFKAVSDTIFHSRRIINVADPIADSAGCKRDIAEFTKLGINTVRVYTVDNSKNHDDCMHALAAAGIYLVLDVNTPKYSLNRAEPNTSYNDVYLQNVFATIDAFANYDNTSLSSLATKLSMTTPPLLLPHTSRLLLAI
jgi:hypothetical protein